MCREPRRERPPNTLCVTTFGIIFGVANTTFVYSFCIVRHKSLKQFKLKKKKKIQIYINLHNWYKIIVTVNGVGGTKWVDF